MLAFCATVAGWIGSVPAPARAEVESVVVRLEEARCFS
jgi:hypothetical protein